MFNLPMNPDALDDNKPQSQTSPNKNRREIRRSVLLLRPYLLKAYLAISMYLAISASRIKTSTFRSTTHGAIPEGAV
jgi:hypothetical protein